MEHPKLISRKILDSIKWKDGNLFEDHQNTQLYIMPIDLLQKVRRELITILGIKVAKNLLYYLNKYSADLIIHDADELGFKEDEKVRYFFAIMALFGWGNVAEYSFDKAKSTGKFIMQNFPEINERVDYPIHFDFCGIVSRIIELVYNQQVLVREIKCIATGSDCCEYEILPNLEQSDQKFNLALANIPMIDAKTIPSHEEYEKMLNTISMETEGVLLIDNKDRVIIKDIVSINSMINAISKQIGAKTLGAICYRMGKDTKFHFPLECSTIDELTAILFKISLMDWGLFSVSKSEQGNYKITLKNSPFVIGLEKQESPICYVVAGVLHKIFEYFISGKKLIVKETKCVAIGYNECEFEIKVI